MAELRAVWNKKRRLIVECSIEDLRNVRSLQKVIRTGAQLREGQRNGKWTAFVQAKSRGKRRRQTMKRGIPTVDRDKDVGSVQLSPSGNGEKGSKTVP